MDTEQSQDRWTEPVHRASRLPLDVVLVVAFVILVEAVTNRYVDAISILYQMTVQLALPFVFFLPGYAILSMLFPRVRTVEETGDRWVFGHGRGLTWGERVVLSFGVSLAFLPLLGLFLAVSGLGYDSTTVVNSLAVVILLGMAIGGVQRLALPATERYHVPIGRWRAAFNGATRKAGSATDAALNLTLMTVALVAVLTLFLALGTMLAPPSAETYSEFSVLTENPQGQLVASGYPQELVVGESAPLVIDIENQERAVTSYTVVGELQRVRTTNAGIEVLERQQLGGFETTLQPDQEVRERMTLTPQMVGEDLRVVYYLYKGDAPAQPSDETAYRSVYFWTTVSEPAGGPAEPTGTPGA